MADTSNHGYSRPDKGTEDWHQPINQNFAALDAEVELRDTGGPTEGSNDYDPTDGAKYLDTDTGLVYTADGNAWTPVLAEARYTPPGDADASGSVVFGHPLNSIGNGVVGATIAGGGRDTELAGTPPQPNSVTADYGTVGGGFDNTAGGTNATVGGGVTNEATGESATVAGGERNEGQGAYATIAGGGPADPENNPDGTNNTVYDTYGTIGGGGNNQAGSDDNDTTTAAFATVGGGRKNTASGQQSTIGGGGDSTASGGWATVGGGSQNTASAVNTTVGGGGDNTASEFSATVAGGLNNTAEAQFATIAGGGPSDTSNRDTTNNVVYDEYGTIGGGGNNQAGSDDGDTSSAEYATVGGGEDNTASGFTATVAGGFGNTASDGSATVGGGGFNTASGDQATVSGGENNTASGENATVPGGNSGAAEDDNSFVYNDNTGYHDIPNAILTGLSSNTAVDGEPVTGTNTFSVSATGGVRFITGSASDPKVTYIPNASAGWTTTSSRAVKTNIDPVDPEDALAGVEEMEVATWEYTNEDGDGAGTTHIGPMAEEFHDAFDVGSSDEHINSINADGAAFAAIQGLAAKLDETRAELVERDERIDSLEAENEQLRERNAELEDRLAAVEDHLGLEDSGATTRDVADD